MLPEMMKPQMDYDTAFKNAANDPWYYMDKAEAVSYTHLTLPTTG